MASVTEQALWRWEGVGVQGKGPILHGAVEQRHGVGMCGHGWGFCQNKGVLTDFVTRASGPEIRPSLIPSPIFGVHSSSGCGG